MPIRLPHVEPCFFCPPQPWQVLEETPLTYTILNSAQFEAGQCLVIPRRHAATLMNLTPDEAAAVIDAAQRLARAMVAAFDPDGVLLFQNNGIGSNQRVDHFHLHVVPRRAGSNWGDGPPHLAHVEHGTIARQPSAGETRAPTSADLEVIRQLAAAIDR